MLSRLRKRNFNPKSDADDILPVRTNSSKEASAGGLFSNLSRSASLFLVFLLLVLLFVTWNGISSLQQDDALDGILAEMRINGELASQEYLAKRNKSEEAYATVLYSSGVSSDFYMYACATAALGIALKQVDPARPRVALVTNITEEARRILSDGDIWQLVEVPSWAPGKIGYSRSMTIFERKAALWDLVSYKRVLFIDGDAFIAPDSSGQRLKRLEAFWQLEALGKWHPYFFKDPPKQARNGFPSYSCVHSAHILLEPNLNVSGRYRSILKDPPHPDFTACIGKDQKVISYLFPHFAGLRRDMWRVFKFKVGSRWIDAWIDRLLPGYLGGCNIMLEHNPMQVDEIHLEFHNFKEKRKVQPFWGGDCTACILEDKACRHPNLLTQPCHVKVVKMWWERLRQLPSTSLQMCAHHLGANLRNAEEACY